MNRFMIPKEPHEGEHFTFAVKGHYYTIRKGVEYVVREKGEWDDSGRCTFANGGKAIRCPFCGACLNEEEYDLYVWNFCPVCGADMRKGENG